MEIDHLRREYLKGGLNRVDLLADPIAQFNAWLQQAVDAGMEDATAMTLATVSAAGQPSQRIVLLKQVDERGFVFYTNLDSRKAQDIAANAKVSLHFPWHAMERQVKIAGTVERVSSSEALAYFTSRPRESQWAAWASPQSRPVASRDALLQEFDAVKDKFAAGDIPLPDFWGGYRVLPSAIEFWQGGANRLHDRFEYSQAERDCWNIQRLAP